MACTSGSGAQAHPWASTGRLSGYLELASFRGATASPAFGVSLNAPLPKPSPVSGEVR
jgi:hypothetical protein